MSKAGKQRIDARLWPALDHQGFGAGIDVDAFDLEVVGPRAHPGRCAGAHLRDGSDRPHMTGDRLVFAGISVLYLVIAMPIEERALRRSFGEAYVDYEQRVRWRILPYLY